MSSFVLDDKDRIFTNLYGFQPWNLKSAQAPRHSTSDKVKSPSSVVPPFFSPLALQAAMTSSDPRSMHGVVPQTWTW